MQLFGNRFGNKSDEEEQIESTNTRQVTTTASQSKSNIGFDTVLGPTSTIEGDLSTRGNIRLDGKFTGTLDITGNVLVGETANIDADIDAANISIAGIVRGNVTGNKVQLLHTARVWGDVSADSFSMEEGAFIDGKISMQDMETQPISEGTPTPAKSETVTDEIDDYQDDLDAPTVIIGAQPDDDNAETIIENPDDNRATEPMETQTDDDKN